MVEQVFRAGAQYPGTPAYEYFGFRRTFAGFESDILRAAASLRALGIKKGDRVMLSMPNVPQAVVLFYAVNYVGAVSCMTHPLSSAEEMAYYIGLSKPRMFVTLYQFYDKFKGALEAGGVELTLLTGPGDALPGPIAAAMGLREQKPRTTANVLRYGDFLKRGKDPGKPAHFGAEDAAALLYSGGTTGKTKGILLSNENFNALAVLTARAGNCIIPNTKMLAVLPVFHGFGLGVCVHTALSMGVTCLLVPRFTVASYAKLLKKQKPNYIVGVPTLFEALLRLEGTEDIDLSMLRGVFSGGDTLPPDLRRRVDEFLKKRGSPVGVREGYGLTECVTACCLTPSGGTPDGVGITDEATAIPADKRGHREGSIGLPFDTILFKIVENGTQNELPYGETGEICVSGPTVMLGYDGDEEETAKALQTHSDGRVWLHTGDLGSVDEDGYVYFRGRLKRMIVTSGYNVYPYQVERTLGEHKYVKLCAVIGVPDEYRMQRVKALLVLRDDAPPEEQTIAELDEYCKKALSPWSRPREFEVRASLPTTLVGKVAYSRLENEQ